MFCLLLCVLTDGILVKNINADAGDIIQIGIEGTTLPSDKLMWVCKDYYYLDDLFK